MQAVKQFNRHMMMLGRESRGMTQTALANAMGASQGTVSKIEAGIIDANDAFTDDLANTLDYLPDFFYQSGKPYGMPPFHYRKRKKLGKKILEKMIGEMNVRRIHLSILLRSVDREPFNPIPEIDRDEYLAGSRQRFTVEGVARHIREQWLLGNGPIENVVELIESRGGVVIPCDFDSDLIDAVSQRIDGFPVLFFVNMNAPADRIRMTLCHELGHMVLHTTTLLDDDVMEREADRFAGAFLLPEQSIKPHLRQFNLRQVANLKRHWKVSMAAIAMRADNLGLITPYQKKAFFMDMGKFGYRKSEPHEPPREVPTAIAELILRHLTVLGYTVDELAKALFLTSHEFERMYAFALDVPARVGGRDGVHLRVVK